MSYISGEFDKDDTKPVSLVPTKPDAEVAADLKRRVTEALGKVCVIMDEAVAQGIQLQWTVAPDPATFRHVVNGLAAIKRL